MFYILKRKPMTTIRVITRKKSKGTEKESLGLGPPQQVPRTQGYGEAEVDLVGA